MVPNVSTLATKMSFTDNAFIDWGFRLKNQVLLPVMNYNVTEDILLCNSGYFPEVHSQ